ncbi:NAD-dependent epimerase/dehydratase family protein [Actinoplanes sp. NPDC048796]|uniref:NAD-dependent epimerase/dehydratase family protein n=1 Tax=unclassified Actinoplanes TaxID=2626549 RepID=UPI0033F6204F
MQIVGRGFLAHHLAPLADSHPRVVAVAAGVSTTVVDQTAEFDREAALLYDVLHHCRATGSTIVFFSTASAAMYGADASPGTENGPVFPTSPYGRHKLALEGVVQNSGVDWLVFRLSHLVGDAQRPHQLLPLLVAGVLAGTVSVHRGGHRDLVDVRHMVVALDRLLREGVRNRTVNIASGIPQPVETIVAGIERRLGRTAERRVIDVPVTRTLVSTALLRSLVPEAAEFGFGPGYLDALLDNYVGPLAAVAAGHH